MEITHKFSIKKTYRWNTCTCNTKSTSIWLKQNSDLCPINETILLDNDSKETISIVKKFGYKIKNRPCKNLSSLYSINKSNTSMFKVNPYKWSIKDTIHIWFLPKQYQMK